MKLIFWRNVSGTAKRTALESRDLKTENNFDRPTKVSPKNSTVEIKMGSIPVQLGSYSVTVFRVSVR